MISVGDCVTVAPRAGCTTALFAVVVAVEPIAPAARWPVGYQIIVRWLRRDGSLGKATVVGAHRVSSYARCAPIAGVEAALAAMRAKAAAAVIGAP